MDIRVLTFVEGRRPILEVFVAGIERLKKDFPTLTVTSVASSPEDVKYCQSVGFDTPQYENRPLGAKFNEGVRQVLKDQWDHLLIMGSDDLISAASVHDLLNSGHDHTGFQNIWFYDTKTGNSKYFDYTKDGRVVGCGRLLSRKCVEHCSNLSVVRMTHLHNHDYFTCKAGEKRIVPTASAKWLESRKQATVMSNIPVGLYNPSVSKGLDSSMDFKTTMYGFPCIPIKNKAEMLDLKSDFNIWSYSEFRLTEVDRDFDWLSRKERDLLAALRT